jgi:hypothetical protein
VNVFSIAIPPLRERREDIPGLAAHFLDKFTRSMNKPITGISAERSCSVKRMSRSISNRAPSVRVALGCWHRLLIPLLDWPTLHVD